MTDNNHCRYVPGVLNEFSREQLLKYLRGTKRNAMTLAFDRAYDMQAEAVRAAEKNLPRNAAERVREIAQQRADAIARIDTLTSNRLNRLFKCPPDTSWAWAMTYLNTGQIIGNVIRDKCSETIESINTKLNEFRDTLGPRHYQPRGWNSNDRKTPTEKAKVIKNKKAAALVEKFTDTLEAK